MTLDDSPLEKMLDDEPLEHLVLDAAMNSRPIAGAPVLPPLKCSVVTKKLLTKDDKPPFGPDHDLTLSDDPHVTTEMKVPGCVSMIHVNRNNSGRRYARVRDVSLGIFSAGRISLTLTGCGSVDCSDWPRADCAVDFSSGEVGISYIRPGLWNDSLIDAAPVTGSLIYSAFSAFCSTDFVLLAGFVLYILWVDDCRTMAPDGAELAEVRAGITFGVKLYVPWDSPEAVVDISSEGVMPLKNVPDVIGLVGRHEGAAESHVLQGRDIHSVRVLVPDCRGVDQKFHDVTIVDMGEVPELSVSIPELSPLSQQWPPAVISHMGWRQKELEEMRSAAKQRFRQSRPSSCVYCGSLIKCDMYRHMARFHLDLAQLWQCPVSWCTVWKGTPQDCTGHLRGAHDVPCFRLEKYFSPWTVTRKLWSDSLSAQHSGISTDVLLFSDIHLSLVHHYRIHKRGLPHIAFRRNYLSQLRVLLPLPLPVALPAALVVSPDSSGSGSCVRVILRKS